MGNLVFQATLGGQVNLVGPNTASTFNLNVPAVAGTLVTTGDTGTVTSTMLSTSTLTASAATTASANKGAFNYGTLGFSDTGIVQSAQTSVNSYFQNVIQNTSNGASASAEFIAYNDAGTATTNYAAVGINSSGYSGTGSINAPGYGYFLTASTDLVLGTIGANAIHLTTNSAAADAITISSANVTSIVKDALVNGLTVGRGAGAVSTNTAVGYQAINATASGDSNNAFGYQALNAVTSGSQNTALGRAALILNTTGSHNIGVGGSTLYGNTTGSYNTAVGREALQSNTTAGANTAVGYQASYSNTTGVYSTAVGYQALYSNTANNNTAVGQGSLYTNSSGTSNVAMGNNALNSNSTGSQNTAIGLSAIEKNTTASNNTAVGYQAGYTNSTGTINTFLGQASGYSNTTGSSNVFVGVQAGYSNTTGTANTFVGANNNSTGSAGFYVTTGNKNTILGCYNGNQGGLDIRTASNYIVLSDGDGNPRGIFDSSGNYLVGCAALPSTGAAGVAVRNVSGIGRIEITKTQSGNTDGIPFRYNSTYVGGITYSDTGVLYNVTSDYRLKTVIGPVSDSGERIDALEPIEYQWKSDGSNTRGFLAHKFQEVYPQSVSGEKDAVDENGSPKYQNMQAGTSEVIADLVAEIQSLRQRVAQLESN
jgi:hypothetical protein